MIFLVITGAVFFQAEQGAGLSPDQLVEYAQALSSDSAATANEASFRELWDNSAGMRGRRVAISGRVVAAFRAPAAGRLPPRRELWLQVGQNLVCGVAPDQESEIAVGVSARIEGTSLGLLRYQSRQGLRQAPLIVGPTVRFISQGPHREPGSPWDATNGLVALLLGGVVVVGLCRAFTRKPRLRFGRSEPDVEFLS
jgi:hypothetical protein